MITLNGFHIESLQILHKS